MKTNQRAQIIVILAVLLMVCFFILAFLLDLSRLMIQKQHLFRAADSAGKAGLLIVADEMVTQVISASKFTATAAAPGKIPGTPSAAEISTAAPNPNLKLLDEDCRKTLVADPMQTKVAGQVLEVIESNDLDRYSTGDYSLEILYPAEFQPDGKHLEIIVRIRKKMELIFSQFWAIEKGKINVESRQRIPWR
jgi:hypothetical protein